MSSPGRQIERVFANAGYMLHDEDESMAPPGFIRQRYGKGYMSTLHGSWVWTDEDHRLAEILIPADLYKAGS